MPRPDEGLIHAWLDGELEAEEAARVEELVATDAEWSAAAAEARGLIAASSRILSALDVVAGDVIPQGGSAAPAMTSTPAPRAALRRAVPSWMKMAAGIALIASIGYVARDGIGFSAPKESIPAEETIVFAKANDAGAPAASVAVDADTRSRAAAEPEARMPMPAPAAAPVAPAPAADAVAPVASTRAAPTDTLALRRALGENRLEGVVVTGIAAGAASDRAERTGAVSLRQQAAKSAAPVAQMAPAAALQDAPSPTLPIIEGCFRVRTRAQIDTLLIDPRILATDADSIRIEIPSARWAWVRRDSTGALIGRVWWQRGTANMRADPIDCS